MMKTKKMIIIGFSAPSYLDKYLKKLILFLHLFKKSECVNFISLILEICFSFLQTGHDLLPLYKLEAFCLNSIECFLHNNVNIL